MEILFRDDRLLAVVKEPGILSTDEPGGLPELLQTELGEPELRLRSVHRLDRTVGGVMVYAATRRAAAELSAQIWNGLFRKEYLAVVHGVPESDPETLRDWLHRDRWLRRTVIVPEGSEEAQEAILQYHVLGSIDGLSLLRVELLTGRTHQIRCQLSGHGYPLVGDRKYGAPEREGFPALWSHRIECIHPRTGEKQVFMKEPPPMEPWLRFRDIAKQKNTSA